MISKKHGSLTGIKGQVTDFIDDQQFWLGEHFHGMGQSVLSKSGGGFASQFQSAGEVEPVAQFGRHYSQGDGEMSFAHPRRTKQDNVRASPRKRPVASSSNRLRSTEG